MRAFNPLPMLAILGVGTLLILAALHPSDPALLPLAAGIVVLALLLLGRLVFATTENLRLLREDAAEQRRRQAERQVLMSRLAGGIAHNINNQMTIVLGHAEMMLERPAGDPEERENNQAIADAAQRAAALAERLVLASGRAPGDRERRPLAAVVQAEADRRRSASGSDRAMVVDVADGSGAAPVGPAAVGAILQELLANAVEAAPVGGAVTGPGL